MNIWLIVLLCFITFCILFICIYLKLLGHDNYEMIKDKIDFVLLFSYLKNHIIHAFLEALITIYLIMGFVGFTDIFTTKLKVYESMIIIYPVPTSFFIIVFYLIALVYYVFHNIKAYRNSINFESYDIVYSKIKFLSIRIHKIGTFFYFLHTLLLCIFFGLDIVGIIVITGMATILGGIWNVIGYCCDMGTDWLLILKNPSRDIHENKYEIFILQLFFTIFAFLVSVTIGLFITQNMTDLSSQTFAGSAYAIMLLTITLVYMRHSYKVYLKGCNSVLPNIKKIVKCEDDKIGS